MLLEVRYAHNHCKREHKGRRPRGEPHAPLMPAQLLGIDLVAGKQEQERKTQLAEQFHRVAHLDDTEHVRPQQRSGKQQQHGLRHRFAGDDLHDDWAQHRHKHDDGERNKIDGHTAIIVASAENRRFAPVDNDGAASRQRDSRASIRHRSLGRIPATPVRQRYNVTVRHVHQRRQACVQRGQQRTV